MVYLSDLVVEIRSDRINNDHRAEEASVLINISDAKAQLLALVSRVQEGGEVLIGKSGTLVVTLVKFYATDTPRVPGVLKGKIKISKDFDTLPEEIRRLSESPFYRDARPDIRPL